MRLFMLTCALALLPACGSLPVKPSTQERSSAPARFDYERDDDLDDDLSRLSIPARNTQIA
jgi:hypothetical protein